MEADFLASTYRTLRQQTSMDKRKSDLDSLRHG